MHGAMIKIGKWILKNQTITKLKIMKKAMNSE